jgi:hypothetical protein
LYTGALAAASNRATWTFSIELTDPDTDLAIDLTGATIKVAVAEQQSKQALLTGSTGDGKVVIATPATGGAFTITFPLADMQTLEAGLYDVGITVTLANGTTYQLLVATLPVTDGIVD